jgi:hypothetical protein
VQLGKAFKAVVWVGTTITGARGGLTEGTARPNFGVKLSRPGFGPVAELLGVVSSMTASRSLQFATRFFERHWPQPRRSAIATRDRPCGLHKDVRPTEVCPQDRPLSNADVSWRRLFGGRNPSETTGTVSAGEQSLRRQVPCAVATLRRRSFVERPRSAAEEANVSCRQ